jgi:hypothetical protein
VKHCAREPSRRLRLSFCLFFWHTEHAKRQKGALASSPPGSSGTLGVTRHMSNIFSRMLSSTEFNLDDDLNLTIDFTFNRPKMLFLSVVRFPELKQNTARIAEILLAEIRAFMYQSCGERPLATVGPTNGLVSPLSETTTVYKMKSST